MNNRCIKFLLFLLLFLTVIGSKPGSLSDNEIFIIIEHGLSLENDSNNDNKKLNPLGTIASARKQSSDAEETARAFSNFQHSSERKEKAKARAIEDFYNELNDLKMAPFKKGLLSLKESKRLNKLLAIEDEIKKKKSKILKK